MLTIDRYPFKEVVTELLAAGANVTEKDINGDTA